MRSKLRFMGVHTFQMIQETEQSLERVQEATTALTDIGIFSTFPAHHHYAIFVDDLLSEACVFMRERAYQAATLDERAGLSEEEWWRSNLQSIADPESFMIRLHRLSDKSAQVQLLKQRLTFLLCLYNGTMFYWHAKYLA